MECILLKNFYVFDFFSLQLWLHRKIDKLDLIDFYLLLRF
jgi:hypothetical protein